MLVTYDTNLVSTTKINEIIVIGEVKVKVIPCHKKHREGEVQLYSFLTSVLDGGWIVDTTAGLDVYGEEKIFYSHQDLIPSAIEPQRVAVLTTLSWSPVFRWCFVNICGYYLRSVTRITGNQAMASTIHTMYINTLRTGDADLRFYVTTVQDG